MDYVRCWEGDGIVGAGDTNRVFPLPTDEYEAWIAQARPLANFACEAVFRIEPSFYIGPDNDMTALDWETANVRLPPLELPRQFADRVTTAELLGREEALIGHYRRVVEIAGAHGKASSLRSFPYFRIQPAVIADGHVLTQFSWTDNLHETRAVLEMLVQTADGPPRMVHDDQDQGWHILVATTGPATCFIEWHAEGPPPAEGGYAAGSAMIAGQAVATLDRLTIIHDRLVWALGRDYWA
jgi:hypothetical protein